MTENELRKNETPLVKSLKLIALVSGIIATLVTIITGVIVIDKNIRENASPTVTIKNELALPVIVTIDGNSQLIKAGSTQTIELYSDSAFPATVKWKVMRNKNNSGIPLGEEIGDEVRVDKGATLTINNQIDLTTYFYPIIVNNTDSKCAIILNDGLAIEYEIGASSPHAMTNITGYYKYASNTNVTLKCADATYIYGERNGKPGSPFGIGIGSGVFQFSIPYQTR